jgi:predicted AlkP superfamily phosphohydrolase/phosphomutase
MSIGVRLALAAVLLAGGLLSGAGPAASHHGDHRLIVLGIDGMDPQLLRRYMGEGILPNLSKLAGMGGFIELGTSTPPQSPVAWSNFITGMDSGGHGIFDFIGLDRETMFPYLSIARVEKEPFKVGRWAIPLVPAELDFGQWRIPLGSEKTLQLRDGQAFWEILEKAGIPTTMFRMPVNYPPVETGGHALSGMGTPDLRGTPGTFSYYTDDPAFEEGPVSGGVIRRVQVRNQTVRAALEGPPNGFREKSPRATAAFSAHIDPENPVAEVRVGDERALLKVGEWSDWMHVRFELVPYLASVGGICRFYLKEISPNFRLYASPINIDPGDPAQPIATPEAYARELYEAVGAFYTQEMPEDTKALSAHVLSPSEFLAQSQLVLDERRRLFRYELERFRKKQRRGLFFFYVSTLDQRGHMLWRQMDPEHPFHETETPKDLATAYRASYVEADEIVGEALEALDEKTTLIVMSDHGFAPFNRQANLNTWLEEQGYLVLKNPWRRDEYEWLQGINWAKTRAYAIGLNSLYLNVRGRERSGIVDPSERARLAREIADKLLTWRDPENGNPVVTQPALREEVYHGPHLGEAPDIVVGYARGYRSSWATTSGKIPAVLIEDNDREWSGDHCMDSRTVPGVLLSTRPLKRTQADLRDLTVSILAEFGIEPPSQMKGRSVF